MLESVLQRYQHAPGIKAWFTANHDENSWNGTEYEKYGDATKAFAVFGCTWPGIPLLYNGQELPNQKRLAFFEKDPISWNGNFQLHDFYKTLLHLRAEHPALLPQSGVIRLQTSDDAHAFAYLRQNGERAVLVVLNLSGEALTINLADNRVQGVFKNVFSGSEMNFETTRSISLQPWDYIVLEK